MAYRFGSEMSMKTYILMSALAALGLSLSCGTSSAGWDDSYVPQCCVSYWATWTYGAAAHHPGRWYRTHRLHKSVRYQRQRVKMRVRQD
jgi:hypothetical protein